MNKNEICGAVMATLFVAGDAVETSVFAQLFDMDDDELDVILQEIIEEKKNREEGLLLTRIGDKLQLCTNPVYGGYIKDLIDQDEQPVTRAEIDEIRGVRSNYAISTLREKGLIEVIGRKDVLGRPSLFATTDEFLRHFGIASLEELPKIDFEALEESSQADEDSF